MFSTDAFWGLCWDCLAEKGQAEESLAIRAPELSAVVEHPEYKALVFPTCYSGAEWQLFCQQQRDAPLAAELTKKLLYQR